MTKAYLIKAQILFCLFIVLSSCNRNSFSNSNINAIDESLVDSITPSEQTEEERIERLLIIDAIDDYVFKQEQIVLKTKPNKVYTINVPDSLLTKLEQGDLYTIDIYYLGELSSSKYKILFEDATYGYSKYSPHASQKLLFYNNQNNLLGYYHMSLIDIPEIVSGDSVRFKTTDLDCNKSTTLNFQESIPDEIFIRCKDEFGDIYSFEKTGNL